MAPPSCRRWISRKSGAALISASPKPMLASEPMSDPLAPASAVLVTGAAGGLGAALVEALLARGDHVVALDRVEVRARDGVRAYAVDLLDEAAVTRALDDAAV